MHLPLVKHPRLVYGPVKGLQCPGHCNYCVPNRYRRRDPTRGIRPYIPAISGVITATIYGNYVCLEEFAMTDKYKDRSSQAGMPPTDYQFRRRFRR